MKENLSNGAIQARKEYFKEWRANNKDKVKSSNEGYWERRAEELKKIWVKIVEKQLKLHLKEPLFN